ncbi:MAG TPA: SprB repeat-containing protein, partial [Fibrella sp.]
RFEVKAFDSATNAPIACAQHTYIAASNLQGFQLSPNGFNVYYKGWTTASLNLSGFAGKTIAVDFASGDCQLGGHFGYGYVDMDCGLFQVSSLNCAGTTTTLTAPPGFQTYVWMDSTYSTVVGTGASITIPVPALNTKYNVVLTPFAGFGCTDTLSTRVNVSTLSLAGTQDTVVCNTGNTLQLSPGVIGNAPPFTYSWTGPGLSCTSCASPSITPTTNGTYMVTVTDNTGCVKKDTINVGVSPQISHTVQNVNCYGAATGSIAMSVTGGGIPTTFSYLWNTQPVQTTPTATGLAAGTHTVTVTDNHGCVKAASIPVTQPTQLSAQVSKTDVSCFGGANGIAVVSATGATPPYTYFWNTSQTSTNLSSLTAGNYTAIVTDNKGCKDTVIAVVAQPPVLSATAFLKAGAKCFGTATGKAYAVAAGGTPPYAYQWSGTAQQTDTASNLSVGTYSVTITDAKGCVATASIAVTQPAQLTAAAQATPALCYGTPTGTVAATATGGTGPRNYAWNTTPVATVASSGNMPAGTYTVTVTDSAGCTSTATTVVSQPSTLNLSLAGTTPVSCFGGSNGTATVAANGGSGPYTYSWNTSPVQTGISASGLPAGTVTATVTDVNGCTNTVAATIAQPSAPVSATAVTANDVLCQGGSTGKAYAIATGGTLPYSYQWNTSPTQATDTASNLPAGTYSVTVTDTRGCSDTASVLIAQPTPLSLATSHTAAACAGAPSGTATVTVTGGTPPMTYAWGTTPVQTTATATSLTAGNYSVNVTDAKGCVATASVTVTQPSSLSAIVATTPANCFGTATGASTVAVAGGTPPFSYTWNTTPVQTTATATNLQAGTYSAIVTDAAGCVLTITGIVAQPPVLNLTLQSNTPVSCFGGTSGAASVSASGGTSPYAYSWNTVPVQTSATAAGLSSGTYTATVVDSKGCSGTLTTTITEPSALTATALKASDVLCHGGTTGKAFAIASGGTSPYAYQWLNTATNQQTDTASALAAGSYSIVVTDANGCSDTASVVIGQPDALALSATATPVMCFGMSTGSTSVAVTGGTGAMSYQWNTTPVQTGASANGIPAGAYSVTVTDAHGCTATTSATVTQPAQLNASTLATSAFCDGTATGTSSVTATGGTAPMSYVWNTNPVQTTATATSLAAGSYTVTVTDDAGCTTTATSVVSQPAVLDLSAQPTTPVSCFGGANGSASVVANGGTAPYTYSWNSSPVQTTAIASGLPAGTYTATVTDANGCSGTQAVTITQPAALSAGALKASDVLCHGGSTGKAYAVASGGTQPYSYQWLNTGTNQQSDTASGLTAGTFTVQITDANGCADTASVTIDQPAQLTIATTATPVPCFGMATGSASVAVAGGTAPMTYLWNTTPVQTSGIASSIPAGAYSVTVTDAHGCVATKSVDVTQPAPLAASATTTPAQCHGTATGVSTVTTTGGTSPMSYVWNTSPIQTTANATGLPAGLYTVTVTDGAGCTTTATSIVSQPSVLDLSLQAATPVSCFGGSNGTASVLGSGGTAPYTYSWNSTPV